MLHLPLPLLLVCRCQAQEEYDARRNLEVSLDKAQATAAVLKETKVCSVCTCLHRSANLGCKFLACHCFLYCAFLLDHDAVPVAGLQT